ncbi:MULTISPECIES: hypothetical protein [Streptomyces]|uniref:Uncharacterized protein n=1 Tax=Streptomyces clavifer TaxID=68188 RepID=A0ABS4VE60_9ACTN|nr:MULTISPECIES: hypothetical protein [Streptomyces]MBP2362211.1 hypothetical protein [Streptomyces clavifer]MDX2747416.1 hypothetical protein [Streptomyces sp. NRRL_B-2557]
MYAQQWLVTRSHIDFGRVWSSSLPVELNPLFPRVFPLAPLSALEHLSRVPSRTQHRSALPSFS